MTPEKDSNHTMAVQISDPTTKAVGSVIDYGEDAGKGFEGTTSADYTLPFIKVLQSGSPEVDGSKGPERRVQGAQAGGMMNSASRELLSELFFVPCARAHEFVEWRMRKDGGGFVNRYDPKSEVVQEALKANGGSPIKLKRTVKNDKGETETHELKETFLLYGLMLPSSDAETSEGRFAVIAFDSTKIKVYKNTMYALDTKVRAPIFANRLRVATAVQDNAGGRSYNFVITHAVGNDLVKSLIKKDSPLYVEAKKFNETVLAGKATADFAKQAQDDEAGAAEVDGKHF